LCTVKLSRKLIPFKKSYSLRNLCVELNIPNLHPHRALGDAKATATLFEMLLAIDPNPTELPLQGLNSSLKPEYIKALPELPGVYYFLDENHNMIYVGKSKNIQSRVIAHLTNCTTRRALEMKNKLASVDYELTGNELIALLLESHEIHRHKPLYNRAQRRALFNYGLYHEPDDAGYLRLNLAKIDDEQSGSPITTFSSFTSGKQFLFNLCEEYRLCQKLCGLYETKNSCFQYKLHECSGACIGEELPDDYNLRVQQVLDRFAYSRSDFLILSEGRSDEECAVVRVENNRYLGFGFTTREINGYDAFSHYSACVKHFPENKYVHSIIRSWLEKNPKTILVQKQV
jgi:DNA polymerase III subunit epsilon